MKNFLLAIAMIAAGAANSAVLTFDDHPNASQNIAGPIGTYAHYTFSCLSCSTNRLDWIDTVRPGSEIGAIGAVSGEFTMLNNFGGIGVIRSADSPLFEFGGLWARTWINVALGNLNVRGYSRGAEIWVVPLATTPQFAFAPGKADPIDELRIDGGGAFFIVDDIVLTAVPEPSAYLLLLTGLGLVGCAAKIRRKFR